MAATNLNKRMIFLWSTRRVLSTPLHRAVFQLGGIKHFCEPFALPYYFGPNRKSKQFEHRQEVANNWEHIPLPNECLATITNDYSAEGCHKVFVKEHALYVWPDYVPDDVLCSSAHSFIIRNPSKAIQSLYRRTLDPFDESVWDRVVAEEVGFQEQWLLYDKIANKLQQPVIVIDADDLMRAPKDVLMKYCEFVGLQFEDKMLDWNDDHIPDKPWDFIPISWMRDMKGTTTFRQQDKVHDPNIVYPQMVQGTIDANMVWYHKLYEKRLAL